MLPAMRITFLICLILLVSCNFKNKEAKYPVIPEDKFEKLLVDYHLAEGVSYSEYYRLKTKNRKHMNVTDSVLKSYGYSRAVFDSTVSYYSDNPEKFDAVYDKVIAKLSRMQAEVQQKMAKKQAIIEKRLEKERAAEKEKMAKKQEDEKLTSPKKQMEVKPNTAKKPVQSIKIK
jgi:hypothetical protein